MKWHIWLTIHCRRRAVCWKALRMRRMRLEKSELSTAKSGEYSVKHAPSASFRFQCGGLSGYLKKKKQFTMRRNPSFCLSTVLLPLQFPRECLSSPACTQIVLVMWEFIMCCGGRDLFSTLMFGSVDVESQFHKTKLILKSYKSITNK